jgi:Protein of unknown function (DUF4242)
MHGSFYSANLKLFIMRTSSTAVLFAAFSIVSFHLSAQTKKADTLAPATGTKHLFLDVHHLGAGKVTYKDVAAAHAKDLAVEHKYGVDFIKYWVDEDKGLVYCLSSSSDSASIVKTHAEAHGLLPDEIFMVTDGQAATLKGNKNLYLDIHELGPGNVTAKDVAAAHQKDLAVENKYGVNFINYWVDEKNGVVVCLSEAKDSTSIIQTHKEAHGLLPASISKVQQGQ